MAIEIIDGRAVAADDNLADGRCLAFDDDAEVTFFTSTGRTCGIEPDKGLTAAQ